MLQFLQFHYLLKEIKLENTILQYVQQGEQIDFLWINFSIIIRKMNCLVLKRNNLKNGMGEKNFDIWS